MKRAVVVVTLLLAGALAGCGRGQSDTQKDSAEAPKAAQGSPQMLALLPADNEVAGWVVSKPARSFNADNLWELINGAADGFVTYGVREVVTSEYKQAGTGYQAVIEIYQMKDPLNAYGKYSEERNPEYRFLQVGNEGYSGGTSVNFWTAGYYVKMTTFQEKDAIQQEMVKLARAVAGKVKAPGAAPRELSYFPKEDQLPHTDRYIPQDVLAQSYFSNGFEARYKAGDRESKLVLIALADEAAAKDGLSRYKQSVTKDGAKLRDLKAPGDGAFAGKHGFYGNVAAARTGKYVVVALGAPTEAVGLKQVADVVANAGRQAN